VGSTVVAFDLDVVDAVVIVVVAMVVVMSAVNVGHVWVPAVESIVVHTMGTFWLQEAHSEISSIFDLSGVHAIVLNLLFSRTQCPTWHNLATHPMHWFPPSSYLDTEERDTGADNRLEQ
jgi:hypothetical protein